MPRYSLLFQGNRPAWLMFAAVTMVSLGIYAEFAARDLVFGDGGELTLAAVTDGVAHPPGYPLWIILGHVFSLLPTGPIPYRLNLSAGIYHALTVGVVYWCAFLLTRRHIPSLAAAAMLAASPLFVMWSLQAEVFSLNDLFAAVLLLLCLVWIEHGSWLWIAPALGVILGLGLANHQTLILCAPFILWTAWTQRRFLAGRNGARFVVLALMLVVVAFPLPYLHTWFASQRALPWAFGETHSLSDMLDLVLRKNYGTLALVSGPLAGGTLWERLWVAVQGIGFIAPLSAAGAAVLLWQRRYRYFWLYGWIVAFAFFGFCAIANIDASIEHTRVLFLRFALMPLVLCAPFVASALRGFGALTRQAILAPAAGIAVALASCISLFVTIPSLHITHDRDARVLVRDAFAPIPARAVVLVKGDTLATTTAYFQSVERQRPDLLLVFVDLLPGANYRNELRAQLNVPDSTQSSFLDLIAANPKRQFFGIGDPDVQGNIGESGRFVAYTCGLASWIVQRGTVVPLQQWYAREGFIQSSPGYGDVTAARQNDDGFSSNVRAYYANGLLNAGLDAERLHDFVAALLWLERAQSFLPNVSVINDALVRISAEEHRTG